VIPGASRGDDVEGDDDERVQLMLLKAPKAAVFAVGLLTLMFTMSASIGVAGVAGAATRSEHASSTLKSTSCSGTPINIMGIEDATGPVPHPQEIDGVKAGIFAANKACSAGRPIHYQVCDDQGSADASAACAREAVSGGDVAVVDMATAESGAAEPILQAAGVPIVGGVATSSSDSTYPYGFMMIYPQDTIDGASKVIKGLKDKKMAFVAIDTPPVQQLVQLSTTYAKSLGLDVLPPIYTAPTATDYAPYAAEAQSEGVQAVSLIEGGSQQDQFITALNQRGVTENQVRVVTTTQTFANSDIATLGAASNGVLLVGAAYPTDDPSAPGIQAYLNGLKAAGINDPIKGDYGLMGWYTVQILAPIFKKEGSALTRATLFKALSNAGNINLAAWHPMNFSKKAFTTGSLAGLRLWSTQVLVSQVTGGKIKAVGGFQSVLNPFVVNLKQ
jgi:branched-chain amino acid transport system substrate-binding protein